MKKRTVSFAAGEPEEGPPRRVPPPVLDALGPASPSRKRRRAPAPRAAAAAAPTQAAAATRRAHDKTRVPPMAAPPPQLDEPPVVTVATLPYLGVVLGSFYSRRKGTLELTSDGCLHFDVVTEQRTLVRASISRDDTEACTVQGGGSRSGAVVLKLCGCSGVVACHVDPAVEERATVLFDTGPVDRAALLTHDAFAKQCGMFHQVVPPNIVAMLLCKLRLLRTMHDSNQVRQRLLHFRGENLESLSDTALLKHQHSVLQALKRVTETLDSLWEDRLSPHLCLCCTEKPATVLLMPCKHLVLCRVCMDGIIAKSNFVTCPVCRSDIAEHCMVYTAA